MKTFGLIGKSLSHSFSRQYFTEKFLQQNIHDVEYRLFPLANIEEVKDLLKHPTLLGFNVTIPYKSEIIPFLDELDAVAQEIGAVNCVVKQNNRWVGYNTDVIGFEWTLEQIERKEKGERRKGERFLLLFEEKVADGDLLPDDGRGEKIHALILGSGGASKAVRYVLQQKGIPFQIVSRKKTEETITYNEVTDELIHHTTLIINSTPLGMFPNVNEMPQISYPALHSKHILIDLIYNPKETSFLKEGKKRGAFTINGLPMLKAQAEASWNLFNSY
ncbi:MAG: shikimate dehydrogenase [Lentimicrobiaceae bacterium]|nr:shikimate dehydrogenase [Lentimicrobiaceae bacterium]